jgi:hypothetical protein
MRRIGVISLFVMVVLYWFLCLLHFIFVVHFQDVVASVVITVVVLSIYKLCTRGR